MDSQISSPVGPSQELVSAWLAANEVDVFDDDNNPYSVHTARTAKEGNSITFSGSSNTPAVFTHVAISALALLKMLMHASSGGDIEVMGLMLGRVVNSTFCIYEAFALPVEGTETRVNAAEDANEYMVEYTHSAAQLSRCCDTVVGWYHSHPGYGCWLSGIDVATQRLQQTYQDPFVAIVIDPHRSHSPASLKVDIGAFRTLPLASASAGATPRTASTALRQRSSVSQPVPSAKAGDFGANIDQYVSLEISYFMSRADVNFLTTLWEKYWIDVLSKTPLSSLSYPAYFNQLESAVSSLESVTAYAAEHSKRLLSNHFTTKPDGRFCSNKKHVQPVAIAPGRHECCKAHPLLAATLYKAGAVQACQQLNEIRSQDAHRVMSGVLRSALLSKKLYASSEPFSE